jgi:chromosomal replication initiation ATPase DnaA
MLSMLQLLLPLDTPRRYSFDNLVLHSGIERAAAAVRATYDAGSLPYPALFLFGPRGVGKTHILKATLAAILRKSAPSGRVEFLSPTATMPGLPELDRMLTVGGAANADPVALAIDDVHFLTAEAQTTLWTLANRLSRGGGALLMAALDAPDGTFPDNPHLLSRAKSGLVLGLEPADDRALLQILDKMARDRNVRISPDVSRYLAAHKARGVRELEIIMDALDRASLELKRRITVPLIKLLEKDGLL